MKAVATQDGRTGLQCPKCDRVDPLEAAATNWVENPRGNKAA
jgi:uncharacterized C2H2 Zn-finger protein